MSNYNDRDTRYTEHTSDQMVKGNESQRRESAMPARAYGSGTQERHRRSERAGADTDTREDRSRQRARQQSYADQGEYDDLPPEKRSIVPILLIALGVILLIVAVYLFLPEDNAIKRRVGSLIGQSEPASKMEVIEFKTTSSYYTVDSRVPFTVTTSPQAVNVRLMDASGKVLDGSPNRTNPDDRTIAIWSVSVLFTQPYEGNIYASVQDSAGNWNDTNKSVFLTVTAPVVTPVPTASPLPTQALGAPTATPMAGAIVTKAAETSTAAPVQTAQPTQEPPQATAIVSYVAVSTPRPETAAPTQSPVVPAAANSPEAVSETALPTTVSEPTAAPVVIVEPAATQAPIPTEYIPEETATPEPTKAPFTAGAAGSSDPSVIGLSEEVYNGENGKIQNDYTRSAPLIMQETGSYTYAATGVHTFRGDNMRQNAAFGTAEVNERSLSLRWEYDLGSLRTADAGTLYGVGWNNQPAVIKWPKEIRQMMNLESASKDETSMREVIFSGQDGKVYFINLSTGEASRPVINIKYPMRGSVSVETTGQPMISFGQAISKLPDKTGAIGYYLYSLIDQKQLYFINGRSSNTQKQYSNNGAFDGCSLFIHRDGEKAMVVAGENGLLYSVDLGTNFKWQDENPTITVSPKLMYQRSLAKGEKEARTTIESAIAMYNTYVYTADGYGIIRCVDTTTMRSVWAFDAGDNTDAAIALDETASGVDLYTGNTAFARLPKNEPVSIRRLNALTGEEIWHYDIQCEKDTKNETSGCKASPVVGQNDLSGLVFFTVNRVSEGGAKLVALSKADGHLVWEFAMGESISSPVAVYNESGNGWIIQADEAGNIYFLDGLTGYLNSTATVEGKIEASPVVYRNYFLIGTCSRSPKMYCFDIK